ncbi:MAG: serine/threonine protein kinase [Proteobacteria bacterium]|nr:serine/threonine protein kinase [Pseudomonadota bacterium]
MKQPEQFGKYLLLGQVAVGGMAEIYKARYADPNMPPLEIAIKRILPSYTEDESFVTMFKDEGNIAIRLKHPNIVNIYEVGEVNNDWYIAMEYIHGTDLRILSDACEKYHKRFTPTQIARVMCETAKALDYAHKCTADDGTPLNIVHRDCTPHNIMISHRGEVKLMDFGIAKAASRATKTRVGTVKGKSSYMSPEQARGKNLDGRSDMFTLGTVAWEMLTGYRLFKAASDFDILTKVLKSEIIHPSDMDSNIPRELGDIFMKTLERDRDMRYPTCGILASALENWLNQYGDGSDRRLGEVVLDLTNKQGHSFSELPDYVPGNSLYSYDDGNFIQKNGPARQANVNVNAAPMHTINVNNAAPPTIMSSDAMYPPPGFPSPSLGQIPITTNKVPAWMFFFIALLFIGAVICSIIAIAKIAEEQPESPTFEYPEASITFKSDPDGATIKLNGEPIKDPSTGGTLVTNQYSYKTHLGQKYEITIEKDGYEPYTSEREIAFLTQTIDAHLKTSDEARAEQMNAIPAFIINTSPDKLTVKVNGEEKGKSPVTMPEVPYGEELKIEVIPESNEYAPESRLLVITKGMDPKLNIELSKSETKVATRTPPPPPAPAPAPAAAPSPTKAQPAKAPTDSSKKSTSSKDKATAAGGKGNITVKANPWATVLIDSKRIGNTTITREYKAGNHKVEIQLPSKHVSVSKTVNVKAGQTVTIGYDFNTNKWF